MPFVVSKQGNIPTPRFAPPAQDAVSNRPHYLLKVPADEPVYQFLDNKRAEGKPYFVYMTAAQNKFLRIYYARVKECLFAAGAQEPSES